MSQPLKVLDLFSGIGGFSLGLERTGGFRTIAFCEIDNYCQRVLRKHWPDVFIHSDIRKLGRQHFENWQIPDVVCGGFPCQDISLAGKGAGLDGERSGLWFEMLRLIGELRPRIVIVENVAALLGRGFGRVLGDLAESGYDAEWNVISATNMGAPHIRERVWIVAHPVRDRHHEQIAAFTTAPDQKRNDTPYWETGGAVTGATEPGGQDVSDTNLAGLSLWNEPRDGGPESGRVESWRESIGVLAKDGAEQWATEPNVGRVAHGIPARVDRLRALGNAIVPQIAEYIGHCILAAATADLPPESPKKEPAEAL